VLLDSVAFTGSVAGFTGTGTGTPATSDKLDLRDINFSSGQFSASYANNVLTVTDGTHTAEIDMIGNYSLSNFHFAADGSTGTLITDPPTNNQQDVITPNSMISSGADGEAAEHSKSVAFPPAVSVARNGPTDGEFSDIGGGRNDGGRCGLRNGANDAASIKSVALDLTRGSTEPYPTFDLSAHKEGSNRGALAVGSNSHAINHFDANDTFVFKSNVEIARAFDFADASVSHNALEGNESAAATLKAVLAAAVETYSEISHHIDWHTAKLEGGHHPEIHSSLFEL